MIKQLEKIEKTIGSMKFAVIIILIFAVILTVGTFVESYYGTDFANRIVYKSVPFMLLQLLMFLSIFVATLHRVPLKKRLYGFYTLHLGLLLLFIGAFVTYYAGVDGNITLPPNTPNSSIVIGKEVLKVNIYNESKEQIGSYEYKLPYNALSTNLNIKLENYIPERILGDLKGMRITKFNPFSKKEIKWITDKDSNHHSASYHLFNDRFGEKFTMGLHQESDFPSTKNMGPLSIHYMPEGMAKCFGEVAKSGYFIWNLQNQNCYQLEQLNANASQTKENKKFVVFPDPEDKEKYIKFFPEFSPLPISDDLKVDPTSPYRVLNKKLFETKPHLFLFGKSMAFYDKGDEKWFAKNVDNKIVELPWMGFKVRLLDFREQQYPSLVPQYTLPIHDNGKIIKGDLKSLEVVKDDKTFYVTNEKPIGLHVGNRQIDLAIDNESIKLPFEVNLTRFKMDTDRGTNNPASYESFIDVFTGSDRFDAHVFMNNPLKYNNFTFYQASYFKAKSGFGSVLSVNFDPGRWLKYLGSLLLVLGSLWHFVLRKVKTKKASV